MATYIQGWSTVPGDSSVHQRLCNSNVEFHNFTHAFAAFLLAFLVDIVVAIVAIPRFHYATPAFAVAIWCCVLVLALTLFKLTRNTIAAWRRINIAGS